MSRQLARQLTRIEQTVRRRGGRCATCRDRPAHHVVYAAPEPDVDRRGAPPASTTPALCSTCGWAPLIIQVVEDSPAAPFDEAAQLDGAMA